MLLVGCDGQHVAPEAESENGSSGVGKPEGLDREGVDSLSLVSFAALPGTSQEAAVAAISYLSAKGERAEEFYLSEVEYDGRTTTLPLWHRSLSGRPLAVGKCEGRCRDLRYDHVEKRISKEVQR
jgi:hypothetical protein